MSDGGAVGALGIKLGGEPQTVRDVATWLRTDVASSAEVVAGALRWARDRLGEDMWWDPAAMLVYGRFDAGARAAAEYADQVVAAARLFDDTADKLEYAMSVLADVPEQAKAGKLEHTDEYVKPPSLDDDVRSIDGFQPDPNNYMQNILVDLHNVRLEYYRRCEELVELAAQTILDQMEKLNSAKDAMDLPVFDTTALVSDETVELVKWFDGKYLEGVREHGRKGVSFLVQAKQNIDSPLWEAMLKSASYEATKVNKYATNLSRTGLALKVLKPIGPLMTPAAIVYQVYSGYSGRRAVLTTVGGAAAGGIAAAAFAGGLLALGVTPPGWLLIIVAFVAGIAAGPVSEDFYDRHIASARERLLQRPDPPDLDPGPERISDR